MTTITSLTREQQAEFYQQQIKALLSGNMEKFTELTGPYSESYKPHNHDTAWVVGQFVGGSLFSILPGCTVCASQIETERSDWFSDNTLKLREKLLKDSKCPLPDMGGGYLPDFGFTREQLEEFARRQLVARYGEQA